MDDERQNVTDPRHEGDSLPEDADEELGAEGGERGDSAPLPFAPHKDDDSSFGDTDQHSSA